MSIKFINAVIGVFMVLVFFSFAFERMARCSGCIRYDSEVGFVGPSNGSVHPPKLVGLLVSRDLLDLIPSMPGTGIVGDKVRVLMVVGASVRPRNRLLQQLQ